MDFNISSSTPSFKLQKAILMYGAINTTNSLATVHDVAETANGPVIMAGTRVTENGLRQLMKTMEGAVRNPLCLLHPNVLATNDESVVWWVPAGKRRIAFDTKEIGKRAAVTPHPALLFSLVRDKGWLVHALKDDERPTPKTKLYVSPYFNVWQGGKICTGSTALPKTPVASNPEAWTKAFFTSAFTHPNINEKNKLVRHEFGPYAFWRDMLDGKHEQFPDVLVDAGMNFGKYLDLLAGEKK
jgi:PRTRC genetic system protein B